MKKHAVTIPDDTPEVSEVPPVDDLIDLMKKNIAWSAAIYKQNKSIQKSLRWMSIMGYVRVGIFLVPIILGIIYLPPLLSGVWDQYQSLIGLGGGANLDSQSVRNLLDQFSPK
ncbi:MAG: hypothetical protein COU32_00100 [Candidatus Magasanikbacteria bacterium CG10_big_fil_rev_8_21_14_0_10_42_10]|uniref:Uncharacterized protein n=2 Tax=Candidatus Magasanikiibacteriota TaxID=1752731 RepID=A0A2H0TX99_9BACT|nr:MAG: hypothetical protein COU32_00100 [Candidatus Magasanikbacteria bacterium CG10_big_fil_rev_8_21_14_0_10_42_10]PIZ93111.1 MAG: hypothetical protein COX82_03320 [Candidatus Magasanikbacteria bacterium CG_4_10_14_0_2_um_filter_41_10]